jgi:hypothetical protein
MTTLIPKYDQGASNAVNRAINLKLGEFVSVLDFGADNTGTTDCTAAFNNAISAVNSNTTIFIPAGTYKFTQSTGITLANGNGARLIGIGFPTLNFTALTTGNSAITVVGNSYINSELRNFSLNCNTTGDHGIQLQSGNKCIWDNIFVQNTVLDAFNFNVSGYSWIEGCSFSQLTCQNAGRHGFGLFTSGSNGAYINECIFTRCEVRGCSVKANGGAAVFASANGTNGGTKMSMIHWLECNFDSQRATANANGFDTNPNVIHLTYTAGQSNTYEGWYIYGGGWETVSANPDYRSQFQIFAESGCNCRGWNILSGSPGGWSGGLSCSTGSVDNAITFVGSISGTTLTVTSVQSQTTPITNAVGYLTVGQQINGTGVSACYIVSQLSGYYGGVGTYQISLSQTVTSRTMNGTPIVTGNIGAFVSNVYNNNTYTTHKFYNPDQYRLNGVQSLVSNTANQTFTFAFDAYQRYGEGDGAYTGNVPTYKVIDFVFGYDLFQNNSWGQAGTAQITLGKMMFSRNVNSSGDVFYVQTYTSSSTYFTVNSISYNDTYKTLTVNVTTTSSYGSGGGQLGLYWGYDDPGNATIAIPS